MLRLPPPSTGVIRRVRHSPADLESIESAFATVWLRTKVTKGAGSRAAVLVMVFKPAESAQARRRAVNAPDLVALVRAGARFERGHLVERFETVSA
ncbi:hypothetical protein ITI46_08715 [Streptomyces oryzae]|uniref:Uncharacterized protein n=1 Tax=Streptomyces oryzae TaxID=1434886 RepID=A0ABS3X8S9_9ACTN|nr:hypothetical protein [Streptomyces oryzae]